MNFEMYLLIYFSRPHGKLFSVLLQAVIYVKCKNDCKILKVIVVPDFGPLKPEIARFSIAFRLKHTWE